MKTSPGSRFSGVRFHKVYFALMLALFLTEVLIAVYVHDHIIRPYVGDVLVVMLIYCFIKSFFATPVLPTAIAVLFFAFLIEGLQYVQLVNRLGLQNNKIASTVIGNSFAWMDVLAYVVGVVIVLGVELIISRKYSNDSTHHR